MQIIFRQIGTIFTEFEDVSNMPIQSIESHDSKDGKVILFDKYIKGLKDLESFSHIYLIYFFHKSHNSKLHVVPFLDSTSRGVFATRAPSRPNAIGISIVRLRFINNNVLYIKDVDILNNTPLLDIKPYVKQFDSKRNVSSGWLSNRSIQNIKKKKSDKRFI